MERAMNLAILTLLDLALLMLAGATTAGAQNIEIDGHGSGRLFEGIGAVSAGASSRLLIDYPEPQRSQILDYLFKPNYGASLQHLKVEIGGDVNSTDGAEPSHMHAQNDENYKRGYEWWLMEQAKRRNPQIMLDALAWGAPGWIGGGVFFSQDNADYIVKFIQGAKKYHGLTIEYVGIWNETPYNIDWVKLLNKTLVANGLTTKIVAPDSVNTWEIVEALKSDPALQEAVYAIGVHYPGYVDYLLSGFRKGRPTYSSPSSAQSSGKPLWASEAGPWRGDWRGAEEVAKMYKRHYIDGKMTKTEIWSPVSSYYDNLPLPDSGLMTANTPWSGHYDVQPSVWATAHTTQFAQPGWQYIDNACGYLSKEGRYVTLKSGKDYTIIIETIDASASQTVSIQVTGGLSNGIVHVWRTNRRSQFVKLADVIPVDGRFEVSVDPDSIYSLTSTAGQGKGTTRGPGPSAFPISYRDDFESYTLGSTPRYFSDQGGIFSVAACSQRSSKCLRQVMPQRGIDWHYHPTPEPETVLGDMDWADYQVSVDAFLGDAGYASVYGRVGLIPQNASRPESYELNLNENGEWSLNSYVGGTKKLLTSGHLSIPPKSWHNLELRFMGSSIEARIDRKMAGQANDSSHLTGMAAIGSGWGNSEFDNFVVQTLERANSE
ncbi:MAG: galactosylceramidase [Acidobacteriia bacterium]|nr:galactosylceramidase [Terriglobia bacterium]